MNSTNAVYGASCNSSHSPAQNEKKVLCTDISAQPCSTASPDKVSVLSEDELENVRPQSSLHKPSDIEDVYLPKKYTPPKHRRSWRLLRKSLCPVSHDEQTLPPRRCRRNSGIYSQTRVSASATLNKLLIYFHSFTFPVEHRASS
ncbi:unnamed protein product [Trichobilharzia szidati]|nr:unnamed protein product [Trichobilharzia szidati]